MICYEMPDQAWKKKLHSLGDMYVQFIDELKMI